MILVDGGTRRQRDLAYNVASFAWKQLMPRIRNCFVYIELKKLKGYHGTCLDSDERTYVIEVDKKLDLEDFITTIFHEMVHVKQYVRKELFSECNFYDSHEEYMNLPWEVEAYEMQEVLLERWNTRSVNR